MLISLLRRPAFTPLTLIAITIMLALWRLDAAPPLWWDEGWTLCVARNWAESGHYGCLLAGEPAAPVLSGALPVIAPVALSFKLFGVGIWQGRIAGLFFTAGALTLLYYLTARLYNRSIAIGTLVILLLMPNPWLHPVMVGKQVLGEMPALFFLLAGYTCFLVTRRKSLLFLPLALGFWGVALVTKVQVEPFWAFSLVVPLAVTLIRRHWWAAGLLLVGLFGSYGAFRLLVLVLSLLLRGHALPRASVKGLYDVTALVLDASIRLAVLRFALAIGLPLLLGLGYATWKWVRNYRKSDVNDAAELVRLMLLTLAGSWFAWYVFLSIGWIRYLFPVVFIGCPFVASVFHDLTGGFNLPATLKAAALALGNKRFWPVAKALTGLCYLLVMVLLAPNSFRSYSRTGDKSVMDVTRFLNTSTPPSALIETYDSELFLFLDRPYHYPAPQVHVELNRREFLGRDVSINYDPLAANPDYLVVGPFSRMWRLYEPILTTGALRLVQAYGPYEVYERVR